MGSPLCSAHGIYQISGRNRRHALCLESIKIPENLMKIMGSSLRTPHRIYQISGNCRLQACAQKPLKSTKILWKSCGNPCIKHTHTHTHTHTHAKFNNKDQIDQSWPRYDQSHPVAHVCASVIWACQQVCCFLHHLRRNSNICNCCSLRLIQRHYEHSCFSVSQCHFIKCRCFFNALQLSVALHQHLFITKVGPFR